MTTRKDQTMRDPNPIEEHPDNVPEVIDDPNSPDVEEPDQMPYPDIEDDEVVPEDDEEESDDE